jgi:hemerythrin-like metal-binding protein
MTEELSLAIDAIDEKHDDFLEILSHMKVSPKGDFLNLFKEMITQTKEHFEFEERLMREHHFYGLQEHLQEHDTLLGEMEHFYEKSKKMPLFGKSYIHEYAYERFKRHITNIDSQLAMFLKEKELSGIS